jgi:hypothetical protein
LLAVFLVVSPFLHPKVAGSVYFSNEVTKSMGRQSDLITF